jgi:ammonium transporter, Amt family
MTPMPAPGLSEAATATCIILIFLVPMAAAGLTLISVGLGRTRSAAHLMMSSLAAISIAGLVYFVCGFSWQGYIGRPAHILSLSGSSWNWLASEHFFFRGLELNGSPASLAALLQMFAVGVAALIPLGSGADRWRLRAICGSTVILAGWTYPLFAHWVWGGGWLAQLGVNYGLGRGFVDPGGASCIQVTGGLTALAVTWILGPRRGKYSPDGMAPAIPGHNSVLILFGCMLALIGWLGLNSAGSILFTGGETSRTVLIAMNTMLSAAAAAITAAIVTAIRFGKPDASLTANGWIAGLVASSATCAFVVPAESVVIGSIAGAVVTMAVEWFELRLEVDDPGGAVSVHAIGGIWGILALGIFARFHGTVVNVAADSLRRAPDGGAPGQLLAQLVGIATLLGFLLPLTYGLNWILNRFSAFRVPPEGEGQGMDLYELGAGAYPEFVTHTDEFLPR